MNELTPRDKFYLLFYGTDIVDLIRQDRTIDAIKLVREKTSLSLLEAKQLVEGYIESEHYKKEK